MILSWHKKYNQLYLYRKKIKFGSVSFIYTNDENKSIKQTIFIFSLAEDNGHSSDTRHFCNLTIKIIFIRNMSIALELVKGVTTFMKISSYFRI